ncbi:4Fe-4S binding protein [Anaerostipes faecalis]|uniref:4Fe-4S binding protein n=1 Tax=Anaerostipes faecalis TaxID=2738446 RepID=UPI003EFC0FDC
MKCSLILFSPTGGTEKTAEILCSAMASETQIFDLANISFDAGDFSADSDAVAVLALPSYGGRVPALAAERLKKVQGKGMPCVLLCVYGNRAYEDTLVEMEDLAKECGFRVIAAVAAVAEHSIIHQYAAGRPDAADEKNLKEIGAKIVQKLSGSLDNSQFTIPGNRPYKKAGGGGLVPKATSACVSCGLCAAQCPAGAIDKDNVKTADKNKCISCMRCVVKCPHKARKVNGAMVAVASMAIKKECSIRKECECYL